MGSRRDYYQDPNAPDQVLPRLYPHTTVTYDRPGIGRSAPLPPGLIDQARSFGALADELHCLLQKLAVETPCVVVGHSIGGLIAMIYAAHYSAHTAGLVLVDTTTEHHLANSIRPAREGGDSEPGSSILDIQTSISEITGAVWPSVPAAVVASAPGRWMRLSASAAAEYAPLTVEQLDQQWQNGQRELAEKLNALLVVADWANHHVATDQPELVAASISAVVAAVGDDRPVTIPAAQLRYAGGSCPLAS